MKRALTLLLFCVVQATAVAALLVWFRPRSEGVKGGDLALELVRERDGVITHAPSDSAPGDRFKVLVTCSAREAAAEVGIQQAESSFTPLPAARIACGNRVALPGAFSLTGDLPARVCVKVAAETSCVTVAPLRE